MPFSGRGKVTSGPGKRIAKLVVVSGMTKTIQHVASAVAAMLIVLAAGVEFTPGTSSAAPVGHQVTYTITSKIEQHTTIAFIANQPANEKDYAEHSQTYLYTVRPKVNPDAPWSYTTTLANPDRWAWVSAGDWYAFEGGYIPPEVAAIDHGYHCEIAVDGHVVVSNQDRLEVGCGTKPTNPLVPQVPLHRPPRGST
jgi:hypothetical protein